jgi:CDP-glucose 4,6-dehydratase
MAAQALVRRSYADPLRTWSSNVTGTLRLLDALRGVGGVEAILVVTSDKVYRNTERAVHFVEDDPLGGDDPYSASKAATELAVAAWRKSFLAKGPPLATARAGNVIGGGDWAADRLVPDMVRAAKGGPALVLRNPDAVRPWQHVLDPLGGYLLYAERLATRGALPPALNFGPPPGDQRKVANMAAVLAKALGQPDGLVNWRHQPDADRPEKQNLALNSDLAARSLGWRPRLGPDATMEWTAEWYKGWMSGADARALTDAQIARYEAL